VGILPRGHDRRVFENTFSVSLTVENAYGGAADGQAPFQHLKGQYASYESSAVLRTVRRDPRKTSGEGRAIDTVIGMQL
jgi:hypothetical protein